MRSAATKPSTRMRRARVARGRDASRRGVRPRDHAQRESAVLRPAAPRARSHDGVAAVLPFHLHIGPYRLAVHIVDRSAMTRRRELVELDVNSGVVKMHQSLTGARFAQHFFKTLVRLIHYSKGCQDGCVEEAYTHSLATGLVEFAHRNPHAWVWFNLLLDHTGPAGTDFARVAHGVSRRRLTLPRRMQVGDEVLHITPLSTEVANRRRVYGFYDPRTRTAELFEGLQGSNLAVVAIHEFTHCIHHRHALDSTAPRRRFVAVQSEGWMRFVRDNPSAWRWLLACMRDTRPAEDFDIARVQLAHWL